MADTVPQQSEQTSGLQIHTIPMEFYGGKNPDPIEFGDRSPQKNPTVVKPASSAVQPVVVPPTAQKKPTVTLDKPAVSAQQKLSQPQGQGIAPYVIGAIAFLLIVAGGSYWFFVVKQAPTQVVTPPPPPVVVTTPTSTEPILEPEPEPLPVPPTSTISIVTSTEPVIIPAHSFGDSEDGDLDGLTDIEEELWGTNGGLTDSDGDSYDDRMELLNLYSPKGPAPQRLIDGNMVSTYVNPEYQYQVYYPNSWMSSSLASDRKEVIFTSITQEFVQITALPFPTDMPFAQWFDKTFPNERLGLYVPFVNRFKVSGVISDDGAVAVITDGSHVYVLTYNGGVRDTINYRSTFRMMVQSFKTANVTTPIDLLPTTITTAPTLPFPVAAPSEIPRAESTSSVDIDPGDVVFVTSTGMSILETVFSNTVNTSTMMDTVTSTSEVAQ